VPSNILKYVNIVMISEIVCPYFIRNEIVIDFNTFFYYLFLEN
jgi:hypothetical protein